MLSRLFVSWCFGPAFCENKIILLSDRYIQCCHLLCVVKLIEILCATVFDVVICTECVLMRSTVEPVIHDFTVAAATKLGNSIL